MDMHRYPEKIHGQLGPGGSKKYSMCYSYTMAASGLRVIHEWLRFYRARGRSLSGLSKRKPRVYYP